MPVTVTPGFVFFTNAMDHISLTRMKDLPLETNLSLIPYTDPVEAANDTGRRNNICFQINIVMVTGIL